MVVWRSSGLVLNQGYTTGDGSRCERETVLIMMSSLRRAAGTKHFFLQRRRLSNRIHHEVFVLALSKIDCLKWSPISICPDDRGTSVPGKRLLGQIVRRDGNSYAAG